VCNVRCILRNRAAVSAEKFGRSNGEGAALLNRAERRLFEVDTAVAVAASLGAAHASGAGDAAEVSSTHALTACATSGGGGK